MNAHTHVCVTLSIPRTPWKCTCVHICTHREIPSFQLLLDRSCFSNICCCLGCFSYTGMCSIKCLCLAYCGVNTLQKQGTESTVASVKTQASPDGLSWSWRRLMLSHEEDEQHNQQTARLLALWMQWLQVTWAWVLTWGSALTGCNASSVGLPLLMWPVLYYPVTKHYIFWGPEHECPLSSQCHVHSRTACFLLFTFVISWSSQVPGIP